MARFFSLLTILVVGAVVAVVALLLQRVGQLDEAVAALVQLLLLPVRLLLVFLAVVEVLARGLHGDPVAPPAAGGGDGLPLAWKVGLLLVALAAAWRVWGERLVRRYGRLVRRPTAPSVPSNQPAPPPPPVLPRPRTFEEVMRRAHPDRERGS